MQAAPTSIDYKTTISMTRHSFIYRHTYTFYAHTSSQSAQYCSQDNNEMRKGRDHKWQKNWCQQETRKNTKTLNHEMTGLKWLDSSFFLQLWDVTRRMITDLKTSEMCTRCTRSVKSCIETVLGHLRGYNIVPSRKWERNCWVERSRLQQYHSIHWSTDLSLTAILRAKEEKQTEDVNSLNR